MGPDVGSETARGPAVPAVRGGIVARRGLLGRATRQDVRLGQPAAAGGELTELRAADLRFSLDEARELFGAAGVELSDEALTAVT